MLKTTLSVCDVKKHCLNNGVLQINHVILYGKYMYGLRKQYKIIRKCVVCKQLNNTELHVK